MNARKILVALALTALSGCAAMPHGEHGTYVDLALGYQLHVNGFEPADTGKFAVEHAWQSGHYIQLEHISHLSDNRVHEKTINQINVGYRFKPKL